MSENHEPAASQVTTASAPQAKHSSLAKLRQGVLVAVLVLLLAAFGYNRLIALPNVEKAYKDVERMVNESNAKVGHKFVTNVEVQAILKRKPAETFTESGYFVEKYSWFGGLPFKTCDLYVVYADSSPPAFMKHDQVYDVVDLKRMPLTITPASATPLPTGMGRGPGPGPGPGARPGGPPGSKTRGRPASESNDAATAPAPTGESAPLNIAK